MAHGASGTPTRNDPLIEASGVAGQDFPAPALYVVATPIGNVADLTVRAFWVLSLVDAIAAEDTRVTRALLERYHIAAPPGGVFAAHQHNERGAGARIIEALHAGQRVALVTDAGTPAISDPGARIVRAVLDAGLPVIPVPGASSVAALLSAAGADEGEFRFIGFLPAAKRERQRQLQALAQSTVVCMLLEAPHRFAATASDLAGVLAPERRVVIGRELTKKFETITALTAGELTAWVERTPPRGEYVLLIDAAAPASTLEIDATTQRWLDALADALPPARAAAVAAKATGLPREALYSLLSRQKP
jgi:16S rRNA (cytidine1402-2'-O)-methyltransferase